MLDVKIPNVDRLEECIVEFEKGPIETGKILFYGDSAFTRWKPSWGNRSLEEDIRMKDGSQAVVNHGFGSSTAEDQLYYYNRAVKPWKPKALVVQSYCNDRDFSYSPEEIVFLQSRLFEYARRDFPGIKIFVCDARPLTKHLGDLCWMSWGSHLRQYNELIAHYCEKHEDCTLVRHIDSPMFFTDPADMGKYEKVRPDIYIQDQVHFNQLGYDLYGDFFRQILDDLL